MCLNTTLEYGCGCTAAGGLIDCGQSCSSASQSTSKVPQNCYSCSKYLKTDDPYSADKYNKYKYDPYTDSYSEQNKKAITAADDDYSSYKYGGYSSFDDYGSSSYDKYGSSSYDKYGSSSYDKYGSSSYDKYGKSSYDDPYSSSKYSSSKKKKKSYDYTSDPQYGPGGYYDGIDAFPSLDDIGKPKRRSSKRSRRY